MHPANKPRTCCRHGVSRDDLCRQCSDDVDRELDEALRRDVWRAVELEADQMCRRLSDDEELELETILHDLENTGFRSLQQAIECANFPEG